VEELRAGARLERLPGPKYLADLSFCELVLESPLPRSATLARWRDALPRPVDVGLVAPPPTLVGPARPLELVPDLEDAMEWLADAVAALGARWLVLPTPMAVSPEPRHRDRLSRYVARLREELTDGVTFVWDPSGPWEPEDAAAFGDQLGALVAEDPLQHPPVGPADQRYLRLPAMGARPRFSEALFEDLLDRLEDAGTGCARAAIASPRSFREAVMLQRLADARLGTSMR